MKFKTAMICVCAALLLALPAFAGDDDKGGFFVGLEATFLQPSGGALDFVIDDPVDDGYVEGDILSLDFDADLTPRLILGWGTQNGGHFFVTWWNYDDDTSRSVASQEGGELWDILFHSDYALTYYQGTADATASMDAEVISFGYSHPTFKSEKFFGRWVVGLRQASLDQTLGAMYDAGEGDSTHVMLGSEMDGLGLMGGLKGTFKLNENWYLSGGMEYALMTGDLDTSTFMYHDGDPLDLQADVRRNSDTSFSTFDTHLALVWQAAESFYLWGGYEFSQWSNAVGTQLFPDDVHDGFVQTDTADVTFDGFVIGAGYKF
jgi:hypothetical protein